MDVIFAATNKFLQFLSGFSHTHRFCYQLVNLCIRHYGIRFPWVKCWPNQRENNVAEKLMFPSSVFPSTPRNIFFLLFFRISNHDVYLDRRQSRQCCWCAFFFFCDSRENLVVGQLGFEKSEVQQVMWNHSCIFLFQQDICPARSVNVPKKKKSLHDFSSDV